MITSNNAIMFSETQNKDDSPRLYNFEMTVSDEPVKINICAADESDAERAIQELFKNTRYTIDSRGSSCQIHLVLPRQLKYFSRKLPKEFSDRYNLYLEHLEKEKVRAAELVKEQRKVDREKYKEQQRNHIADFVDSAQKYIKRFAE